MDDIRIDSLIHSCKVLGDGFANNMVLRPELLEALEELKHRRQNMAIWDYAVGQEYVKIEQINYGGDVIRIIAEIPLLWPDADRLAETVCNEHNAVHDRAERADESRS